VTVEIARTVVEDNYAPGNDWIEVTASVIQGTVSKIFVRLVATGG
jgi:hypothetical protein